MRVGYAIVFVSDMSRSVAFYRDIIGLPLRFESSHWTEFATEGAILALHLSDQPGKPGEHSRDAPGCCRPGFTVSNLDDFHCRIVDRGVECLQEPRDVFGSRIALYLDPDGLAFSIGEARCSDFAQAGD